MAPGISIKKQRGAVLLVLLTIVVLGAATLLVSKLGRYNSFLAQDQDSMESLAEAKTALIGWAASHPDSPGLLPFPDRNDDGNYDGESDCPASPVANTHLTGQLPRFGDANIAGSVCSDTREGVGTLPLDGANERLWYAVSSNLVEGSGLDINSNLRSEPNNWLNVYDNSGNLLTNRAAAVIMAPGAILGAQARPASPAAPNVNAYLESATVGGPTYNNADLDLDFVAAQPGAGFNDRLIYITIDELMDRVEQVVSRRLQRDVQSCIDAYAAASNGKYPWAAELNGAAAPDYDSDHGAIFGRIPETLSVDVNPPPPPNPDPDMQLIWGCHTLLPYWNSWRELFFYRIDIGYQPSGAAPACAPCLTLDGVGGSRSVVMMAGGMLGLQQRSTNADKGNINNYLEGDNANGDTVFENQPASATFNDRVY